MSKKKEEQKEIDKGLKVLIKSSMIVFIGIFISKIFTYLYRIVVARSFGPEIYGIFALGLVFFGFSSGMASFGIWDGIVRFIPIYRAKKEKENIRYLIKFSKKILLFSGIVFGAILFFASEYIVQTFFHDDRLVLFLKIFAILIPIQIFSGMYFGIMRAYEKISANSFGVNILQSTIKFLFLLLLIFIGMESIFAITSSYFIGILGGLIFSYLYCRIKLKNIFGKTSLPKNSRSKIGKDLFSYSWPLIIFALITNLAFWIDSLLIGFFNGVYWVGIYNVAVPLALLLLLASEVFTVLFFPLITRELFSKNKLTVEQLSKQVTKWVFLVNFPLFLIIILFPETIIQIIFGSEYLQASTVLRLLALGQFPFSLAFISSNLLLAKGKSKLILKNLIFIGIVNFILNYTLIPLYGINGAALATSISLILLSIIIFIENYYINSILPFRRKMLSIFASALIPVIILLLLKIEVKNLGTLFFSVTLFLLIYIVFILLTNSLDKNDFMVLKSFKEKIRKK